MRLPVRIRSDFEPPVVLATPGISLNAAAERASEQEGERPNAYVREVSDVHETLKWRVSCFSSRVKVKRKRK